MFTENSAMPSHALAQEVLRASSKIFIFTLLTPPEFEYRKTIQNSISIAEQLFREEQRTEECSDR
jgi:hypothetical protein